MMLLATTLPSLIATASLLILSFSSSGVSGVKVITGWDKNNVITQCSSGCTFEQTYFSAVYDNNDESPDPNSDRTNGGIAWVESDVQSPGMKVVTDGGDSFDASCIMTSGYDPENPDEEKQCDDAFQTSKRFKRFVKVDNGAVDLVFNVETPSIQPTGNGVYRVFEKYINLLDGQRISEFRVQLGVGFGPMFDGSQRAGLSFTTKNGIDLDTSSQTLEDDELDGFFAFGLFGNKDEHQHHDFDGYFDPTSRAFFTDISGTTNEIVFRGVSDNYASLYGNSVQSWLSKNMVPSGFVYDHDDDSGTEGKLMADWNGQNWQTFRLCEDPLFVNLPDDLKKSDECRADVNADPIELSEDTVSEWRNSQRFLIGPIEDFGNVNLNYHIKIGDDFTGSSFTLRIVPNIDAVDAPTPWADDESQDCDNVFFILPADMMHKFVSGHCKENCIPTLLIWIWRIFFGWEAGGCGL